MIEYLNNKSDLSDVNTDLLQRLNTLVNTFANSNCWYHHSCYTKFYYYSSDKLRGRQMGENMQKVLKFVIDYILLNKDECQFSVLDIMSNFKGNWHDVTLSQLKTNLEAHFSDDIKINCKKEDLLILYLDKFESKLTAGKNSMSSAEKLEFIEAAAHMLLEDIRSECYDTSMYKSPTTFLEKAHDEIPESLHTFLNVLVKKNKRGKGEEYEKKLKYQVLTISHVLIKAVRPKSFNPTIFLGVSLMMHRKHEVWLGNKNINPEEFGWKIKNDTLIQFIPVKN